jgi:hypothetical protein
MAWPLAKRFSGPGRVTERIYLRVLTASESSEDASGLCESLAFRTTSKAKQSGSVSGWQPGKCDFDAN